MWLEITYVVFNTGGLNTVFLKGRYWALAVFYIYMLPHLLTSSVDTVLTNNFMLMTLDSTVLPTLRDLVWMAIMISKIDHCHRDSKPEDKNHFLCLNDDKTEVILFRSPAHLRKLKLDNLSIERVSVRCGS